MGKKKKKKKRDHSGISRPIKSKKGSIKGRRERKSLFRVSLEGGKPYDCSVPTGERERPFFIVFAG